MAEALFCERHAVAVIPRGCSLCLLEELRGRALALEEALLECNAVCLCGCPDCEHEDDACGASCGKDDHECLGVAKAVLAYVEKLRSRLLAAEGEAPAPQPATLLPEIEGMVTEVLEMEARTAAAVQRAREKGALVRCERCGSEKWRDNVCIRCLGNEAEEGEKGA